MGPDREVEDNADEGAEHGRDVVLEGGEDGDERGPAFQEEGGHARDILAARGEGRGHGGFGGRERDARVSHLEGAAVVAAVPAHGDLVAGREGGGLSGCLLTAFRGFGGV